MAESYVLGISGVFFLGLPSLELYPMWSSEWASLRCREDQKKFAVRPSFCDVHLITRLPWASLPSEVQVHDSGLFYYFILIYFILSYVHYLKLLYLFVCTFDMWMKNSVER